MAIQLFSPKRNAPIRTLDEWLAHAPPTGGKAQWVDCKSAKELARAWCPPGAPPAVPAELAALVDSHADLKGTAFQRGWPERRVTFDARKGGRRVSDLVVLGEGSKGRVALSVEAKADETFDTTLATKRAQADQRKANGKNSNLVERVDGLIEALLPAVRRQGVEALRFQLFAATAGALAFAHQEGASQALLVIHEFACTRHTGKVKKNHRDLEAFVQALSSRQNALQEGSVIGPIHVPGSAHIPADIPLYIGWVVKQLH